MRETRTFLRSLSAKDNAFLACMGGAMLLNVYGHVVAQSLTLLGAAAVLKIAGLMLPLFDEGDTDHAS